MARTCPYLQRRGEIYFFRIFVPMALRQIVGTREITKSLSTRDRRAAQPVALQLGSIVTKLFNDLRMPGMSQDQTLRLLEQARQQLELRKLKEQHLDELMERQEAHIKTIEQVRLQTELETLRKLVLPQVNPPSSEQQDHQVGGPQGVAIESKDAAVPRLSKVIGEFLARPSVQKTPQMLKKHLAVLGLLSEVLGHKLICDLRQSDIIAFFDLVGRLPPRWRFECNRRNISPTALAEEKHQETLGPKTIEATYIASMKVFLKYAISAWQDQGLPATLTTDGIEYQGDRKKGENRQRALTTDELKRLFGAPALIAFKNAPDQEHKFWLPAIGLYTGARVNEICQLNPQTDVCQDTETGIWYFWITEDTESDERVRKSTKNESSRRRVPVHSKLLEMGLLTYVARVCKQGAKVLFPAWKPVAGRASHDAEEWFREFLSKLGLRDETPGQRVVGMHAFRSTFMARASNTEPPIDATPMSGHSGTKSRVVRGYEGELDLINKKKLLEAIDFKFDPLEVLKTTAS